MSIQRFTQHSWPPGGVHTLGRRYKQISGRTISGPACQPGSPPCHQWSDSCCVTLQPCKRQVCLPLKGSLLHTAARQQQPGCLPGLKLSPPGQKYGGDTSALATTTRRPQRKTGLQVSGGWETSPAGRCSVGAGSDYSSLVFMMGFRSFIVQSFWPRYNRGSDAFLWFYS